MCSLRSPSHRLPIAQIFHINRIVSDVPREWRTSVEGQVSQTGQSLEHKNVTSVSIQIAYFCLKIIKFVRNNEIIPGVLYKYYINKNGKLIVYVGIMFPSQVWFDYQGTEIYDITHFSWVCLYQLFLRDG